MNLFKKAGTSMNIESRYVEGKARGFKHNPEVHDQLAVLKIQKSEISVLKKSFKAQSSHYKKVAACITKGSTEYLFFITEGRQNPKLGTVYNMYSDYLTKSNDCRQSMLAHFTTIEEEWKFLSRTDLKGIESKLDQANKALVTRQYYESNKEHNLSREWDTKYCALVTEFVHLLHALREKKESIHPQFILRALQAELILTRQLLQQSELAANAILQFGPVDPIRMDLFRLIAREPYPMTDDEKKRSAPDSKNPYAQNPSASSSPYGASPVVQTTVVTQTYSQPQLPTLPPVSSGPKCQGLYQFNASSPQELSFNVGDVLNVLDNNGSWWRAELHGREGMIPSNYVQMM